MKWAKSQIDMGRTVSIPEFAEFCNAKTHDDKNIIDLELTETFTEYHNITFENPDFQKKYPLVTLNHSAIGKLIQLDPQIVQTVMGGVISIIGETLAKEENILIDLGRLGRLHGINREVRYYPFT